MESQGIWRPSTAWQIWQDLNRGRIALWYYAQGTSTSTTLECILHSDLFWISAHPFSRPLKYFAFSRYRWNINCFCNLQRPNTYKSRPSKIHAQVKCSYHFQTRKILQALFTTLPLGKWVLAGIQHHSWRETLANPWDISGSQFLYRFSSFFLKIGGTAAVSVIYQNHMVKF